MTSSVGLLGEGPPQAWLGGCRHLFTAMQQKKEAKHNFEKVGVDIIDPGKCQTADAGWDAWQIAFVNKVSATSGAAKVPIVYVIQETIEIGHEYEDDEQRMYKIPLIWNIGINTAKRTLQVTTQRGIRTAIHPLHRQHRVNHLHLNRR